MTLQDFTTEELLAELDRRNVKRLSQLTTSARYAYAEGIVTYINGDAYYRRTYDIEWCSERPEGLERRKFYKLKAYGFKKEESPEIGDKVRLRGRITNMDPTGFEKGNPMIIEIIK